jgi:transcriptional regulator with XRE-family HTH domain
MSFQDDVARAVAAACSRQGISREELAEKMGYSRSALYGAQNERGQVGLEFVEALAKEAGLNPLETVTLGLSWLKDRAEADHILRAHQYLVEELMKNMPSSEWLSRAEKLLEMCRKSVPRRRGRRGA